MKKQVGQDRVLEIVGKKQEIKVKAAKLRLESAKLNGELAELAAKGVNTKEFADLIRCW